jgi:low affinity Fe/Cu permease
MPSRKRNLPRGGAGDNGAIVAKPCIPIRARQAPNAMKSVLPAMNRIFTRIATLIATAAGRPLTFLLAVATIVVWAVTGPLFRYSDTWQLVINTGTTIVTFLMVFLIQNSQNRDGAAIQAKLDELLRAVEQARSHFVGIEHMTDEEIEQIRAALEKEVTDADDGPCDPDDEIEQLLRPDATSA